MAVIPQTKPAYIAKENKMTGVEVNHHPRHRMFADSDADGTQIAQPSITTVSPSSSSVEKSRLPNSGIYPAPPTSGSTFHIYHKHEVHLVLTPLPDPTKDRRLGPTLAEQKAKRLAKKTRQACPLSPTSPDDNAFLLHTPYLSFHCPPQVLYLGDTKHAAPAILIHSRCFWREYKLQLGPTIVEVLDSRGVVGLQYHADKKTRKADESALKGYRVRGWRLWGETGKSYVHGVKKARETGEGIDPDVFEELGLEEKPKADEVVYLRWTNPFSVHTRRYHFSYRGIDFWWKGTGTVKEDRCCGFLLRYCHLKLVAKSPATADEHQPEVCLGKYTASVASKKSGTLVLFDAAILRLVDEHVPALLGRESVDQMNEQEGVTQNEDEEDRLTEKETEDKSDEEAIKIARVKKSTLYQVIVATATCMIRAEKEKRHTLMNLIISTGDGAGGAAG
ncbi:hypothetical protein P153DRAFT_395910 [Dothidotthia symphoricarpi CBS 119687]|uniref:Uncharacterized protein n=1 Tax=Dothidotthia symphoricarpi CBS 119687 TaxID=1392245 RepID=A0A6A6AGY2_9PLEO|nr:uncharacterized protein P153DRAFT_395910 [Dothidotthia symphoricarpi CBS 119687]KAF2130503.1 hypothetical protein P153DRAFT_395910 [Dothidotthia symphoricarpi CBS 119687]